MALLHPFRALRPVPDKAEEIACVPYDVINTEEARRLAEGRPLSFLHVIRPEIDLPEGTDEHADAVYEKGAENLKRYAASSHSLQEDAPSLYVYRLIMNGRAQTGIFGCVSVSDYDENVILKHELTRPTKEDDRTRHIMTQQAHAEPVMLTFRDDETVAGIIADAQEHAPLYDLTARDGVQHTLWRVGEPQALVKAFGGIEKLYVADGHHRCKAASRAAEALRTADTPADAEFLFFPAVLFPMGDMEILAYNRIIRRLPDTPERSLSLLESRFDLTLDVDDPVPSSPGTVCLYLDGRWHRIMLPETTRSTVADRLDVARLSEHLLEPMLNINNPRTDPNIDFVGGIRGTDELERVVDAGKADMALSMYPTSIQDLIDVSDANQLMPPKSTWFEPKLRSGLLVHLYG